MNPYSTELAHHGILGQRWGKKNGPPYPLDAEDHSSSEKKAGWRKSISNRVEYTKEKVKKDYNKLSDRNKTILKRAGVAAATLATVSAIQTAKNAKVANEILDGYGKVAIKTVLGKGAVQAGKVAAVTALATVGAHKLYDYSNPDPRWKDYKGPTTTYVIAGKKIAIPNEASDSEVKKIVRKETKGAVTVTGRENGQLKYKI